MTGDPPPTGVAPDRANDAAADGVAAVASDRAISSALDATLALLLISAAVTTLLAAPTGPPASDAEGGAADATVEVLATSTDRVEYTLAPGARRANSRLVSFYVEEGPRFERVARGTLAALLARATVGNATVRGREITHASEDLEREVRRAVRRAAADATRRVDAGSRTPATAGRASARTAVQVRTRWRLHEGSSLRSSLVVGSDPPGDVAVHAATLRVDSGMPAARERAVAVSDRGFGAVARVVANATVRGLFPPERARLALDGDYPVAPLMVYRYRRVARLLGIEVATPIANRDVATANARIETALIGLIEGDLRRSFEDPRAAARNVSVGTVTVVVRTWSP